MAASHHRMGVPMPTMTRTHVSGPAQPSVPAGIALVASKLIGRSMSSQPAG
jgi:hypothetical protein